MIPLFYTVSILIWKEICDLIVDELWIMDYVKNIPTKQEKKKENTRISRAKENSRGKECAATPPSKGKKEAFGVITTRFFAIHRVRGGKKPFFVSVSKNVAKEAVTRNLLKRRVRAIFRSIGKIQGSYCVVVKPAARMVSFEELKKDFPRL
jgi:ribonuclease P protein component